MDKKVNGASQKKEQKRISLRKKAQFLGFLQKIDSSAWYEELSAIIGISIPVIQEYLVKKYSTIPDSPFSSEQEIIEEIPRMNPDKDYWSNVNTAFFQEMSPKGDWLTQEYIDKQTPEDQHELSILNTTIQRISEESGLSRAELLKNIGSKDKDYLYWMWRIF